MTRTVTKKARVRKPTDASLRRDAMALPPGTRSKGARKVYAVANRFRDAMDAIDAIGATQAFLTSSEVRRLNVLHAQAKTLMMEANDIAAGVHFNTDDRE